MVEGYQITVTHDNVVLGDVCRNDELTIMACLLVTILVFGSYVCMPIYYQDSYQFHLSFIVSMYTLYLDSVVDSHDFL